MGFSIDTKGEQKYNAEPNVVPLCDVLLVLLIIFMVVTPLVQKGVEVSLPNALNTTDMPDSPEVVLTVRRDSTMYVNQDIATLETLQNMLEEAFLMVTEKKLFLRADEELEFGKLVDVIDIIRESGIEIMGIITEKKAGSVE
jgi:biopolymer transport protein ExbD